MEINKDNKYVKLLSGDNSHFEKKNNLTLLSPSQYKFISLVVATLDPTFLIS